MDAAINTASHARRSRASPCYRCAQKHERKPRSSLGIGGSAIPSWHRLRRIGCDGL